jgi:hypothetical protein
MHASKYRKKVVYDVHASKYRNSVAYHVYRVGVVLKPRQLRLCLGRTDGGGKALLVGDICLICSRYHTSGVEHVRLDYLVLLTEGQSGLGGVPSYDKSQRHAQNTDRNPGAYISLVRFVLIDTRH